MREKEGEQAHSPGRAKRNFNTFCDSGVWKYDHINGRTYGQGEWEKTGDEKLQKWPHSCSVRFVQSYGKLDLHCLPRAASNLPLAEAVVEEQVHPVRAEGFPGSWNIELRKIGIIFDMH